MISKPLERYFAQWDPMEFIKDLGAPEDEYSPEARRLTENYKPNMTPKQVGNLTHTIFVEMIELDYEGFKDEAIMRGEEIKSILDSN